MAIEQGQAVEEEPKKRGCLFWFAVFFLVSAALAAAVQVIGPKRDLGAPAAAKSDSASQLPAFAPLNSAQKAAALRPMVKDVDKVEDTTFYYDRSTNQSLASSGFYAYAAQNKGQPWLRLVIRYAGSDWLFFNHITIKTEAFKLELAPVHPERHVGEGYVAEWIDSPVTRKEYALLTGVAIFKHAVIRLEGPQFYRDRTITPREKAALARVVMAYRALGAPSPPP